MCRYKITFKFLSAPFNELAEVFAYGYADAMEQAQHMAYFKRSDFKGIEIEQIVTPES